MSHAGEQGRPSGAPAAPCAFSACILATSSCDEAGQVCKRCGSSHDSHLCSNWGQIVVQHDGKGCDVKACRTLPYHIILYHTTSPHVKPLPPGFRPKGWKSESQYSTRARVSTSSDVRCSILFWLESTAKEGCRPWTSAPHRRPPPAPSNLGWLHLGGTTCLNATCPIRPRLFYACFVVSGITISCYMIRCLKKSCVR